MVTPNEITVGEYYQHDNRMMVGPLKEIKVETDTVVLEIMGEMVEMSTVLFQRTWNLISVPNLEA